MPLDAESIRKILELEARKGYHDSAVIGGLDKLLSRWSAQVLDSIADSRIRKRFRQLGLGDQNYSSLKEEKRPAWVAGILDFLTRIERLEKPPHRTLTAKSKAGPSPGSGAPLSARTKVDTAPRGIDSSITSIKGISTNMAARFHRLGVSTIRDLLYFFPRRHLDYSERKSISMLAEGKEETIVASVWEARVVNVGRRRSTEAIVGDDTGNIRVVWFNNPYVARSLKANSRIVISGRVGLFRGQHVFESPEWEVEESETIHTGRLVPL